MKFVATTEIVCQTVYSVWGVCVASDEDVFPPPAQDDPAPQFQRRNEEEVAPVGEDEELPVQDMCVVSDGDDFSRSFTFGGLEMKLWLRFRPH